MSSRQQHGTAAGLVSQALRCGVMCGVLASVNADVAAEPAAPYSGKQIRMVIASGAGGGYDTYARVLTRHLNKHIAGNPTIINQNMPSAAGMAATNFAYSAAAPRDGTMILATYNSLLAEPLYGNSAARYDPLKFEPVGSIAKQQNICATWHTSPIKSIEQAKTREMIVSATGASSDSASLPRILNAVLGTKFKVIMGYGTTEQRLAVERGEVDGVCGLSYSTLKASNADWILNKRINILIQTGAKRQADLASVPLLRELVTTPADRQVIDLLSFAQEMGRPFVMPPDTPKDMATVIRRGFDATLRDPLFLADAERALLEVDPVTGEEMEELLKRAYAAPKALVQKAAEYSGALSR